MGVILTPTDVGYWRYTRSWTQIVGNGTSNGAASNSAWTYTSGSAIVGSDNYSRTKTGSNSQGEIYACSKRMYAAYILFSYGAMSDFGSAILRLYSGSATTRRIIDVGRATAERSDAAVSATASDAVEAYVDPQAWVEHDLTALIAAQRSGSNYGIILLPRTSASIGRHDIGLSGIKLSTDAAAGGARGSLIVGGEIKQILSRGLIIGGEYKAQSAQGIIIGGDLS